MKTEATLNATYRYSDIPLTITNAIKSRIGVTELSQLSIAKKKQLKSTYRDLFASLGETDYHDKSIEYTLRYFPINFFKIWTPLRDLLLKGQILTNCSILELGCGPGSSTMGFMEFYRMLAYENPAVSFKLHFVLLEREHAFCDIFQAIYNQYARTIPNNLIIDYQLLNEDITTFFECQRALKFDYIIESNALNPNERISVSSLGQYCDAFARMLNVHASIILIEPAKEGLREYLYKIKNILAKNGLSIFSPCTCNNDICKMFPMACVDISGISLINNLRAVGIIDGEKRFHYFEYTIMRNDFLVKHQRPQNDFQFSDLLSMIGKTVKFEAYILYAFDHENSFDLKICDGSKLEQGIYLCIPKNMLTTAEVDLLSIGRGGYIKIKNAEVVSENRIECRWSTMIEIM